LLVRTTETEGKAASQEAIAALEAELGCWLSDSFKAFVQTYDGAKPETNFFKIGDKNESGVRRFIPVDEIRDERAHIEYFPQKKPIQSQRTGWGIMFSLMRVKMVPYFFGTMSRLRKIFN